MNSQNLFDDFDFTLLNDADFKEDSVREELILPILKALGYKAHGKNQILRSKTLSHPIVKIGSKSRNITNFPDYSIKVHGEYKWILDAKSPTEKISYGENVEQAYFYAIHPEVRVNFYALCNGKEFVLFEISSQTPILHFPLSEIGKHWQRIEDALNPAAFTNEPVSSEETEIRPDFDYLAIKLPSEIKKIEKQSAKRHFGVHGYFTKQAWKVVHKYIENFTRPGDVVLDPFGGSGVTVIESLMLGRKGIHIDINPLSVFIVSNLTAPIDSLELKNEAARIEADFIKKAPRSVEQIKSALNKYPHPKNIVLMKDAM